ELIERVLSVRARLTPDHRPRLVVDHRPFTRDALAVRLHVSLLEVGRETVQILIVGKDRMALGAEEVGVPDPEQTQHHRHVPLQGTGAEVLVHLECAGEQTLKVVEADEEAYGESDRRPERVPSTDPIPEDEHVLRSDPEPLHFLLIGGERDEMTPKMLLIARLLE